MDGTDLLTVEVVRVDAPPVALVRVRGELDFGTTPRLVAALQGLPDPGEHLVFDLGELRFCDSSGLGALIAAYKTAAARGAEVYLTGVSPTVRTAIGITSLDQLFHLRDDVPAVYAELAAAGGR